MQKAIAAGMTFFIAVALRAEPIKFTMRGDAGKYIAAPTLLAPPAADGKPSPPIEVVVEARHDEFGAAVKLWIEPDLSTVIIERCSDRPPERDECRQEPRPSPRILQRLFTRALNRAIEENEGGFGQYDVDMCAEAGRDYDYVWLVFSERPPMLAELNDYMFTEKNGGRPERTDYILKFDQLDRKIPWKARFVTTGRTETTKVEKAGLKRIVDFCKKQQLGTMMFLTRIRYIEPVSEITAPNRPHS